MTNIQEDHLGLADIHTLDDLTRVKNVIVDATKKDGWAVLNADNEYCVRIGKKADCKVAYFSMDENNPIIRAHCMSITQLSGRIAKRVGSPVFTRTVL